MSKSLKEGSRDNYISESGNLTHDQLKVGCLMRIADATEVMAKEHNRLLDENKWLRRVKRSHEERIAYLERSNAALKGHLGRAKRQLKESGDE